MISAFLVKLVSAPAHAARGLPLWLMRLPISVKVALVVFFLLAIGVPVYLFVLPRFGFIHPSNHPLIITLLIVIIPFLLWVGIEFLLVSEPALYPDIADAWREGLTALAQERIHLQERPLSLVLGTSSQAQEQALFAASRFRLIIRDLPSDPKSPLRWYVSDEGIFVVASTVGCLGTLAHGEGLSLVAQGGDDSSIQSSVRDLAPPTDMSASSPSVPEVKLKPQHSFGGGRTIGLAISRGFTVIRDKVRDGVKRVIGKLDRHKIDRERRRLAYLCRLMYKGRTPYCPVNGLYVVLGLHTLKDNDQLADCLGHDVDVLINGLGVRCPVTVVVATDGHKGFEVLAGRFDSRPRRHDRLGKGYGIDILPTFDGMKTLGAQAAISIEGWILHYFKKSRYLESDGNWHCFKLLVDFRKSVRERLESALKALARGNEEPPRSLLVQGCYFADFGSKDAEPAFVKATLTKLLEDQSNLAWTPESLERDARYRRWTYGLAVVNVLIIAAMVGLAVWVWKRG